MTTIKEVFLAQPNLIKKGTPEYDRALLENNKRKILNNFEECANFIKNSLENVITSYVVPEMREHVYVTGGSIGTLIDYFLRSKHIDYPVKDYGDVDIWFRDIPSKSARKAQYKHLIELEQYDSSQDYPSGMGIRKAFTFLTGNVRTDYFTAIQFIAKFIDSPTETVSRFDYEHCKPIYDCKTKKLHITSEQIYSVLYKKLIPNEKTKESIDKFIEIDKMPILKKDIPKELEAEAQETLKRITKYYKRGYKL